MPKGSLKYDIEKSMVFIYGTDLRYCISQETADRSIENCNAQHLFPSLFYHIHLNPGLFIVRTVHDSINGNEIIYT